MDKIILLEDNPTDVELISRQIKQKWPDVELAVVGRIDDARELIKNDYNFDVAIFDLNLPDGNGMDLLIEMRALKCEIPIIILTGGGSEEMAITALNVGANDYISKKPGYYKQIPDQIQYTLEHTHKKPEHFSVLYAERHQHDIDLSLRYFKKNAPNFHFTIVSTGEEILNLLPENDDIACVFDIILLDFRLHGLNALEICKEIRQIRKLSIPIVIVTGQGDEKIAVDALKIGVDDYIIKHSNYLIRLPSILTSAYRRRELERQQLVLQQSETKYRLLADYAADWEYWINPKGEYVYISSVCEKTSGYPIEAYRQNKNLLSEITLPAYRKHITDHFSQKIKTLHKPIEFQILSADGKEKWISHFCQPVYDNNNNYLGKRGVNRDITERKHSEEIMRRMNLAINNSGEVIFMTDIEGIITFVNSEFTKMYGYTAKEVIGKVTPRILKSDNFNKEQTEQLWNALLNKQSIPAMQYINKCKNGKLIDVEGSTDPIIDDNGEIIGFLGVQRDITERKKAEHDLIKALEKATESDRLKSAFLANMSHEIRTPMNGILGFANLLRKPNISSRKQLHHINIIEQSSKRLLGIIDDLMIISKIEAGQTEVSISEVNINDQLDQLYSFFEPEVVEKGLKFIYKKSLSPNEAVIKTDNIKLYGILSNIIKNAIKFTDKGSITFGASTSSATKATTGSASEIKFYVKDTGIGITKDRQEAIFDRFVQADIEDSEARQGAGLGLSIAKAYVSMLGGKIWVDSEPGKGSQFYFTISVKSKS